MRKQLQEHLEKRVQQCVALNRDQNPVCLKMEKKKECLSNRSGEIVKAKALGKIKNKLNDSDVEKVFYHVHFQYLINHKGNIYIEEEVEERIAEFYKGVLVDDEEINVYELDGTNEATEEEFIEDTSERTSYMYDRLKAVRYAEQWWNSYNPAFRKFEVDCTNYISQCIHAGGAPMIGYPNRSSGWWMRRDNWAYTWTVAHSLRWFLPNSKQGLKGKEVSSPKELKLGDIICYDFQGDGRFDHTTIVTAKDADGMPLVNAHTTNSRMRYWAYEDSTAYTPNIKYKFFHILDSTTGVKGST
ncbi:amidase domain-containing protein [Bacillus sp. 31A1R]|uniref:Amidase domain-containing protein n=1 Tax=Robertmurraya mangrovi TaxID=3098077 RepID=A0ABU5J547_9BACI|nr:amidase domain-containing protein [Bacillus sp. 31A1R]MDZ5474451.1 amidase domain-containing protein [Bacillus sp. 31A1R]